MEIPRREFLKLSGAAAAVAGLSLIGLTGKVLAEDDTRAMLLDVDRCNGCRLCEAACREWNGCR